MAQFEQLSPAEFEAACSAPGRHFLLDVRDGESFERGHVPGSSRIHVHEIVKHRDALPASKITRILLVGDEDKRTRAAANWFVLMGYADVAMLSGGFAAWTGAVETGPPAPGKPRGPELRML